MNPIDSNRPPSSDLGVLSPWACELAQTFVSLAGDIALVIDEAGVIRNVAQGGAQVLAPTAHDWVGQHWADTASGDTRGKVESLLKEAGATGIAGKREINHPTPGGGQLALAYTAIRLGQHGPLLAVGRDLGAISAIQQRFLDAQQELERGYWRARQAEARYRLLFQVATDAVLVVDAHTFEIMEANQSASQLFDMPVEQILGRPAAFGFERFSRASVDALLTNARASGQMAEIRARLVGKAIATSVAASPFRAGTEMRLLMRVRSMAMPGAGTELNATLARLVDGSSDGVVVTDSAGHIQMANPAFLKLVRMRTEAALMGRPLMDWVGVSVEQFSTLFAQVRSHGITRGLVTGLLPMDAQVVSIEMSAALLTEGDQERVGFTVRLLERPAVQPTDSIARLGLDLQHLSAQVGHAPLDDLLRQASMVLERHFFAVALQRAGADPTAAASMLGVSRQRLESALRDPGNSSAAGD
jgi:transcriptional regulator PpsR